jgi:hypothetical protein
MGNSVTGRVSSGPPSSDSAGAGGGIAYVLSLNKYAVATFGRRYYLYGFCFVMHWKLALLASLAGSANAVSYFSYATVPGLCTHARAPAAAAGATFTALMMPNGTNCGQQAELNQYATVGCLVCYSQATGPTSMFVTTGSHFSYIAIPNRCGTLLNTQNTVTISNSVALPGTTTYEIYSYSSIGNRNGTLNPSAVSSKVDAFYTC